MSALSSLAHLAGGPEGRGGAPAATWAEYQHIIETTIKGQPRSQQKRIGPSELGTACLRCLARKLAGVPEASEAAWLPWIGTAVHAQLEETFVAFNGSCPAGEVRFLVETQVSVGEVDGVDVTGHADLYDCATAEITDWKIVGASTLRSAKVGPSATYRAQQHLYGRGFVRRGLPVDRVRIAYLPRNNPRLDAAVIWSEPYDETVATECLARANALAVALRTSGADALIPTLPVAEGCFSCPRYDSSIPRPGHPAKSSLHSLVA